MPNLHVPTLGFGNLKLRKLQLVLVEETSKCDYNYLRDFTLI